MKVSPNIQLNIIFTILLFSKNVFASANIIYNQSLCQNQYFQTFNLLAHFVLLDQVRNQEFFRAGEFSRNQGTLINIHKLQQRKKCPAGKKISVFFAWKLLKTEFYPQMTTIRAFPPKKIRALFSNFQKRARETAPPSPLQLRACRQISFELLLMFFVPSSPSAFYLR